MPISGYSVLRQWAEMYSYLEVESSEMRWSKVSEISMMPQEQIYMWKKVVLLLACYNLQSSFLSSGMCCAALYYVILPNINNSGAKKTP